MNSRVIAALVAVILLAGSALWVKRTVDGMRPTGTDDQQIRQMLIQAEAAAERRDANGVSRYLSENYQDGLGLSDSSMRYQIGRYLREHANISLNIPSNSVEVAVDSAGQTGQVSFQLEISVSGAQNTAQGAVPMSLKLKKDPVRYLWLFPGQEWRVVSSEGHQGAPE